jgi:hypothetical protein
MKPQVGLEYRIRIRMPHASGPQQARYAICCCYLIGTLGRPSLDLLASHVVYCTALDFDFAFAWQ